MLQLPSLLAAFRPQPYGRMSVLDLSLIGLGALLAYLFCPVSPDLL